MKNLIGFLILAIFIFTFCKSNKNSSSKSSSDEKQLVINFEKNPCFGTCPFYRVKIYDDGTMEYEGLNFVKVKGQHTFNIKKNEIQEMTSNANTHNFFNYNERYDDQNVTDIPSTNVGVLNENGEMKNIYARANIPDELSLYINFLHKKIMEIVDEQSGEKFKVDQSTQNKLVPMVPRNVKSQSTEGKKIVK